MLQNTIRSFGLFAATTVLLFGVVVGSILLAKNRSAHYIAYQGAPTATPRTVSGAAVSTQKQQPTSSNISVSQVQTPVAPRQLSSLSSASQQNAGSASGPMASQPREVPATGPSIMDHVVTGVLMMCAAYFGLYLVRTKADWRP